MGIKVEGASRGDLFRVDADCVVIPGPEDPLYDPRVEKPLDDGFVENIAEFGVIEPVVAVKVSNTHVKVAAGRRRTRAVPLANVLRAKRGLEPLRVPCVLRDSKDPDLYAISVCENENREDDDIFAKALKAKHLLSLGMPKERVAIVFGVSKRPATLDGWLKLLTLDDATVADVRARVVTPSAAMELAQLAAPERRAAVAEARAAAPDVPVSTATAREAVSRKKGTTRASAARKKLLDAAVAFSANKLATGREMDALASAARAYAKATKRKGKKK